MNVTTLKEVKILNYKRSRIKDRWIFNSGYVTHFNKGIVIAHQVWSFHYFIFYITSVCCTCVCMYMCASRGQEDFSCPPLQVSAIYSLRQGLTPNLKPTISAAWLSGQQAFRIHLCLFHTAPEYKASMMVPQFYVSHGDSNPGAHPCTVSHLPTQQSPQLRFLKTDA